ncbi:MAG TPA: hypothetical protein VFO30_05430 [Chthoniobacterales bacterium]|nr:hypothetical protein [Chthoniobacterales bacterium]
MADAESIRQAVRARAPFSTWLGVIALFFLFGVIVLAVVGPAPRGDTYEEMRARKRIDNLKAAREADAKELGTYGWIDKNKGTVRVPIDRAMQLAVAELAKQKPAPAYAIAPPAPQASQAPAGAATPAAPALPTPQPSATPKPISVAGPESENRAQPAAAANPPGAQPGTQPGASASPAASPASSTAQPAVPPSPRPAPSTPPGSPLPVRGKTPPPGQ